MRYKTGNTGVVNRTNITDKTFIRPARKAGELPKLPKSLATDWTSYGLDASHVLILSDTHIPYHDTPALNAALEWADQHKVDCVLLNGDIIDFYSTSNWNNNPAARDLVTEVELTKDFLLHIRKRYPKAKVIYKKGNHEERLDHYIWRKCPELWGLPNLTLQNVLELDNMKVELVEDQRIIKLGKLSVLHGHEFPRGMTSPVNPARGFYMRGNECVLGGHYHRSSEHTEPTMTGRDVTTWSAGCLCNLNPEYSRLNKWNHGAAYVTVRKDGNFHVTNFRIKDGKVF